MSTQGEPAADRVLVLTPFGRDAEMVRTRLMRAGLECEVCTSVEALLASLETPAGAALISWEALVHGGADRLLAALEAQEPWSDLPVILLAEAPRGSRRRAYVDLALFERANITILERPIGSSLLVGTLRAAIRARRRQYETRDLLLRLKRAIELGDMFLSILVHDLRSPLSSMRMGSEVILQQTEKIEVARPASRILRSVDRMTRMIDQLLDFAASRRPEGMMLQTGRSDLDEIVWPIVQEIEDTYPATEIKVVKKGELGGKWDSDRLGRVVSNLLGNAVKHGTLEMPVTVDLDGTEDGVVRMRVSNSGSIPARLISTLFEPFKRTKPSRTGEKGLGLGLFIAHEIVTAHGGSIAVTTIESDMTVFEVVLPRNAP